MARTLGAGNMRILFRHILPNSLTPLIVQGTLGIGTAIIEAAALGFLGMGAQPPDPEWGGIVVGLPPVSAKSAVDAYFPPEYPLC